MMTILTKHIDLNAGHKYRQIIAGIRSAMAAGEIHPGDRLPPQRELADALGVTLGTVTRAYQTIDRIGLARGEIGRGTYLVRPEESEFSLQALHNREDRNRAEVIRFDLNFPVPEGDPNLPALLCDLGRDPAITRLLRYQPTMGLYEHRQAACRWLQHQGMNASPERLAITTGAQHALQTILAARLTPGEALAVDPCTYPGIANLARMLHLRLVAVDGDDMGMRPDLLERAAATQRVKGVYLIPTLHNPTSKTMPDKRRQELAEVIRRSDLFLAEDDVYGAMADPIQHPITTLVPERGYYVANLSKTLAPGLRVGFLVAPESEIGLVEEVIAASIWHNPPLVAEIASRWIDDGTASRVLAEKRQATARRMALFARMLGDRRLVHTPGCLHAWLPLPAPWTGDSFAREALRRGVQVIPAINFATGGHPPEEAVRICIGPPRDHAEIIRGAKILATLMVSLPRRDAPIM
jgi:DNA-binding transcriptional MocR family regulator